VIITIVKRVYKWLVLSEPFILFFSFDIIKVMNKYTKKQFKIAGIFIAILTIIIVGIWFLSKIGGATCFDNIQNQGEKGIDCGGPCGLCPEDIREVLIIVSDDIIPTTENNFDFVFSVRNPNKDWGVESVKYDLKFFNSTGLVFSKQVETYILPGETKYIIEQKLSVDDLSKIDIELNSVEWRKLKDFNEIDLRIKDQAYNILDNGGIKLFGTIENKSNFDLNEIQAIGLLFNNGKIISVGQTNVRTMLTREDRYFEINWPYEILEEITSFELNPYTNVFLNENFIKTYGTPERFKEY